MSALALDEFTLEMRHHFIDTTKESIERFKTFDQYFVEMRLALDDWMSEAGSNEMPYFVQVLGALKTSIEKGSLVTKKDSEWVSKILLEYLDVLKTEPDSQALYDKYSEIVQSHVGNDVQLYLQCATFSHHFIVPIKNVIEIAGAKKVYPLPFKQSGINGLVNFRGQGIPVVDLGDFGFVSTQEEKDQKSFYIVCEFKNSFFALEVQSTSEVIEVNSTEFQKSSASSEFSPVVDYFVVHGERSLMLLDVEKLVKYE